MPLPQAPLPWSWPCCSPLPGRGRSWQPRILQKEAASLWLPPLHVQNSQWLLLLALPRARPRGGLGGTFWLQVPFLMQHHTAGESTQLVFPPAQCQFCGVKHPNA